MDLCKLATKVLNGSFSSRVIKRYAREELMETIRYLIATDKSLALNIRNILVREILALFPTGTFEDRTPSGLYDTQEEGKGFRAGYVSFALQPKAWTAKGILGGILVSGQYDTSKKSTSPESSSPNAANWPGNPEFAALVVPIDLWAGYYTKTAKGGLVKEEQAEWMSQAEILFDDQEEVQGINLLNPGKIKKTIETIVEDILQRPVEEVPVTQDKGQRKKMSPYSGLQKFLKYLVDSGRDVFYSDEVTAVSQWTGKTQREIKEYLQKAYKTYDHGKNPEKIPVRYLNPTPVVPEAQVAPSTP
jgi:hypothetical protein